MDFLGSRPAADAALAGPPHAGRGGRGPEINFTAETRRRGERQSLPRINADSRGSGKTKPTTDAQRQAGRQRRFHHGGTRHGENPNEYGIHRGIGSNFYPRLYPLKSALIRGRLFAFLIFSASPRLRGESPVVRSPDLFSVSPCLRGERSFSTYNSPNVYC